MWFFGEDFGFLSFHFGQQVPESHVSSFLFLTFQSLNVHRRPLHRNVRKQVGCCTTHIRATHSTAQNCTAPHISAPPRPTHKHRLASLCANDPDNNQHGGDGDDGEAVLFHINSIRSLYCEIKLQDWSFYMIHPAQSMSVLQSGLWNEIAEGPRAPPLTISDHITSIHLNHTFLREVDCVLN